MFAQKEALVRLLRDGDPETVRLVKEQLVKSEDYLEQIRELTEIDDARVSHHAREILDQICTRSSCEEFSLLCHFFGEGVDLEQVCWMLARALDPSLCTKRFENMLDGWGRQFLVRISGAVSNRERVCLLAEFLSSELGFRGNSENYYSERNSLMPRVIETRGGLPITLTMLYMMVGSRAAMKIDGINLPGHFIARHGEIFFDPFHRGRILSRFDMEEILSRQGLKLTNSHLQPATPRQFLIRILANLLYVYKLDKERSKHCLVQGWMNILASRLPVG